MTSRKRKSLSLQEKLNILRAVKENPMWKTVCIAKELGLTPSTLNSIVAKRIEIEENARTFDVKCKQARSSEHVQLDKAVFEWFKQARAAGVNFNGTILREKALEIADKLGIDGFCASNGWIDRFKNRHGLCYRTVNGEAASVDTETVEAWKETMRSLASVERGQQPAGVTILDAMHYLASAWSAVTAATVEHCFNKCFGVRADDTTEAVGDGAFADCDELNTAMETSGSTVRVRSSSENYSLLADAEGPHPNMQQPEENLVSGSDHSLSRAEDEDPSAPEGKLSWQHTYEGTRMSGTRDQPPAQCSQLLPLHRHNVADTIALAGSGAPPLPWASCEWSVCPKNSEITTNYADSSGGNVSGGVVPPTHCHKKNAPATWHASVYVAPPVTKSIHQ
ncbi:hypothetical protein HPB52_009041 [Rhipicephalus sanguineus]|uniref:HTH CENPB-type domain-containing protein n=1 Tax=Rhipicephalus sanguineus TaxID=34632 RepID=A0A9D4T3K1_RHISA|nr:hypothetical protein HPB52_009041 [Rhipicephalus sanguineus]